MFSFSRALIFLICSLFCLPLVASAANFVVTPAVIDGKGKAREILRYTITVENTSDHLVSLYPWVTDIDNSGILPVGDGGGSFDKEAKESLTRWIEVTRGVIDLMPGDRKEIPVLVHINLNAVPDIYHAAVHFSEGPNRAEAEAGMFGTLETMVNIEVLEDKNVRLQLGGFLSDKGVFMGKEAAFSYSVENIGNRGVTPGGKIRIFDRKGEEIATIDANGGSKKIEPTEKAQIAAVWAAKGEFGKYKAMLDLEYGDRGTIQDTVFFWVLPWGKIISYFLSLVTLSVIVALLLHSRMMSDPRRAPLPVEGILEERVKEHHERKHRFISSAHPLNQEQRRTAVERHERPKKITAAHPDHQVTLAPRSKPRIDPAHIVDLKRRT